MQGIENEVGRQNLAQDKTSSETFPTETTIHAIPARQKQGIDSSAKNWPICQAP